MLLFAVQPPASVAQTVDEQVRSRPFRILHVMSYHSGWEWNDNQLRGFEDALSGLDYELEVFEMDTKRNSSEDWKLERATQAQALIDVWAPDLVYANDDNAQFHVVRPFVGGEIPFVFSGVNADPSDYGFTGSSNVTGVLEREHSLQTVALLRQLVPGVKRIAVVVDEGPTWPGVIREMRTQLAGLRDHHCDLLQGHLLGAPMPLKTIEQRLRASNPVLGPKPDGHTAPGLA
jgi:hypothetical protein